MWEQWYTSATVLFILRSIVPLALLLLLKYSREKPGCLYTILFLFTSLVVTAASMVMFKYYFLNCRVG